MTKKMPGTGGTSHYFHYTEGAEKSQQCHKDFLQYSTFASERSQFRTWGRQTCFLPRTPSNLVAPLPEGTGLEITLDEPNILARH